MAPHDNQEAAAAAPRSSEKRPGKKLWVFGYGSLCWYPGFPYEREVPGFIKGFSRRFYQGNTAHRGRPDKPGRVVTLVQDHEGITWGKAYELTDEIAYEYLEQREGALGGYTHALTWFWPSGDSDGMGEKVQCLVYMATEDSPHWLGPASLPEMAVQVATSQGAAGHNAEYVLRLAEFMRTTFPQEHDDHLYTLEHLVLIELKRENRTVDEVMNMKNKVDPALQSLHDAHAAKEKIRQRNSAPAKLSIQKPPMAQCVGTRCLKL